MLPFRAFLLICTVLLGCAFEAKAHPNLQNAMWVQFEPSLVRAAVNVSLKEISVAQGLALHESSVSDIAALNRAAERHCDDVLVLPLFSVLSLSWRNLPAGFHPFTLRYGSAAISCGGAYYLVAALHEQVFTR